MSANAGVMLYVNATMSIAPQSNTVGVRGTAFAAAYGAARVVLGEVGADVVGTVGQAEAVFEAPARAIGLEEGVLLGPRDRLGAGGKTGT